MSKLVGAGVIGGGVLVAALSAPPLVSVFLVAVSAAVITYVVCDWAAGCQVVYEGKDRSEKL